MLTLQNLINTQTTNTTHGGNFTEYTSKKQLLSSSILSDENNTLIQQLKNCFCFSLHTSNKFLIITMYYTTTKKYAFYVVNLTTKKIIQQNSIKNAKQFVITHVNNINNKYKLSNKKLLLTNKKLVKKVA